MNSRFIASPYLAGRLVAPRIRGFNNAASEQIYVRRYEIEIVSKLPRF